MNQLRNLYNDRIFDKFKILTIINYDIMGFFYF
jgi:hypothetical protein